MKKVKIVNSKNPQEENMGEDGEEMVFDLTHQLADLMIRLSTIENLLLSKKLVTEDDITQEIDKICNQINDKFGEDN